jgi:hypothetical protein
MLWDNFSWAAAWWFHGNLRNVYLHSAPMDPVFSQCRIHYSLMGKRALHDSVHCLNYWREHSSSKLADKMYVVYSLLQQLEISISDLENSLLVATICRQVTMATILQRKILDLLDVLLSQWRMPEPPSWVPDWTAPSFKAHVCVATWVFPEKWIFTTHYWVRGRQVHFHWLVRWPLRSTSASKTLDYRLLRWTKPRSVKGLGGISL